MTTAEKLVKVLSEKKMTCATAESCTGGGVGYAITGVSGSSAVFWGGVISYDNSVKRDVLGVPEEVLATKGAVSPECAAAMAEGARRLLKTDLAVSLTGIAGPGGGTAEKPTGRDNVRGQKTARRKKRLDAVRLGDRRCSSYGKGDKSCRKT